MKVTAEEMPDRQIGLQIELEEAEIEQHKQRNFRKLVQRYTVPGFRKGKAPRTILERFLGPESLVQEDLEDLLERSLAEAIEQQELEPVVQPRVTDVDSLDPITFRATVPLKPDVDLGDYKAIRLDWTDPEVDDAQVDETIDNLRRQGTPWEPVEREVRLGDLLTIDASGYVDEDPEDESSDAPDDSAEEAESDDAAAPEDAADEAESDDLPSDEDASETGDEPSDDGPPGRRVFVNEAGISYLAQEGVTYPAPGFPEHLLGMTAEETREFTIHVPDDFTIRNLNGKDAHFTVTVREVKEQNPPELNDEWAKTVEGFDDVFEAVEDLRERIRSDLSERTDQQVHAEYEDKILESLTETATVSFPPAIVEMEIDRILQDQDEQMRGMGISLASYAQSTGQGLEQLRDSVRPQAEQRVLRGLLVSHLAEQENIEPSEEEIEEEVERVIESQENPAAQEQARQVFQSEAARETVQRRLVARKTMDMLVEIARGQFVAIADSSEDADAETDSDPNPEAEQAETADEPSAAGQNG